jgi:hypothetical protein
MKRGTIFIIGFVLLAVAVVAASQFFRAQPALEIRVAVSPLAEEWITEAVNAFNATNPLVNSTRRVHFTVESIDDAQVWLDESRRWTPEDHPQAWIPAASFSVQFASENRLPFATVQPSLARTVLVWGGYSSVVDEITDGDPASFDWASVQESAPDLRLAFNNPARTLGGLSVLLSSAAHYHSTTSLTGAEVNDSGFREWITSVVESVPNFNTLGASVAETLAARGPSVGQIGILPENEWLQNLRGFLAQPDDPIVLSYPEYSVVFEFPLARWEDSTNPNNGDEAAGVEALGRWLADASRQANAENFGLRPAQGDPVAGLFTQGEPYGAMINPLFQAVQPPSRNDLRQLVGWVANIVR